MKIGLYDPIEVKRGFDNIGLTKVKSIEWHASDKQVSDRELSRFSFGPVNESHFESSTSKATNQTGEYPL